MRCAHLQLVLGAVGVGEAGHRPRRHLLPLVEAHLRCGKGAALFLDCFSWHVNGVHTPGIAVMSAPQVFAAKRHACTRLQA